MEIEVEPFTFFGKQIHRGEECGGGCPEGHGATLVDRPSKTLS